MPARTDIKKVLVIGSGPIVIGQACEFDYSGTQACKALKEEGYEVVLVNSNPATIMTDPGMADRTYIEPLTIEYLEKIIAKEKPDALLPNLGGQTGLNLSSELSKAGVLRKYGVELIGVSADAIERGEDREIFKSTMKSLNIDMPKSSITHSVEEAEKIAGELGYPVVLRPAYTLGGTGGGIAYNVEELQTVVARGLAASIVNQVLVEEAILGWEELELEVVRDAKGNKITVCFIENVDPMGVHTGDSFCVAPMLTVPKRLQERLQEMSYRIVDAIGVLGGCNIQFAHNIVDDRVVIIEINPRTSRSSALASKATGFPIARISTKLAVGITLDEIPYFRDGTLDKYTPGGDYVVVKFARWAFEKFPQAKDVLGTQMKSVGEVMSIGKNFKEALQKAIRSLETKRYGLGHAKGFDHLSVAELKEMLMYPTSERIFLMYEALRKGLSPQELYDLTKIGIWFIQQMKELVEFEEEVKKYGNKKLPDAILIKAKEDGFSDRYLSELLSVSEDAIRAQRLTAGKIECFEPVPVSGADAAYYYSTYNAKDSVPVTKRKKVMILGGGPNRIGQGIEFDYTCVHAALTLRQEGMETILVNCNPETVSTDYDTSDKLYFEPLTVEDVLSIYEKEKPIGAIVQFGGQTPLNLAEELKRNGIRILGTSPESIALAEDRRKFAKVITKLRIPQPTSGTATSVEEAMAVAKKIGYPLMVRPSFVLGGRGMRVVHDERTLREYAQTAIGVNPEHPMLIDRFLANALEVEVDAISDGKDVCIPSIMEHIELAGIHSGDSACIIPPQRIPRKHVRTIERYTRSLAKALKVKGLMNVQYAIADDKVYILEANPRASRTVPLVSKVIGLNMAKVATQAMLGKKLKNILPKLKRIRHVGVKEAVFPFDKFPEVDPVLGPEMRSTGEVMGIAKYSGTAYYKAQEAAGYALPLKGTILFSIAAGDSKNASMRIAKMFHKLGYRIVATEGTRKFFEKHGLKCGSALKINEGRPNIVDDIVNRKIDMIVNTPSGGPSLDESAYIRKAAIRYKTPYMTTLEAAKAAAEGIAAARKSKAEVKSLQEYHGKK
ncbi:MAG: carbamoyl-phosphate synthase large subunit [Candidatus Altiarchaeota archaeon]